jgi:hypothetical protein
MPPGVWVNEENQFSTMNAKSYIVRKGLRKVRKYMALILSSLRPWRKAFAPFAVKGF